MDFKPRKETRAEQIRDGPVDQSYGEIRRRNGCQQCEQYEDREPDSHIHTPCEWKSQEDHREKCNRPYITEACGTHVKAQQAAPERDAKTNFAFEIQAPAGDKIIAGI